MLLMIEQIRKNKKGITVILLILTISIIIYQYQILNQNKQIVTPRELRIYINEYFSMYYNLVEENFGLFIVNFTNIMPFDMFYRFNNNPNNLKGIISKSRGVAITYDYSENPTGLISIEKISDYIEYYFWPNMNRQLKDLGTVGVLSSEEFYESDSTVNVNNGLLHIRPKVKYIYTGNKTAFKVDYPGAIEIYGELYEIDKMILKGNNNKIFWSRPQADLDALSHFLFYSKNALSESQIIELENKYKAYFTLDKINYCLKVKFYKENPHFFYEDFDELLNTGFTNDIIISKIWENYDKLQSYIEPTMLEKIYSNRLIIPSLIAIISTIFGTIFGYIYRERKENN